MTGLNAACTSVGPLMIQTASRLWRQQALRTQSALIYLQGRPDFEL